MTCTTFSHLPRCSMLPAVFITLSGLSVFGVACASEAPSPPFTRLGDEALKTTRETIVRENIAPNLPDLLKKVGDDEAEGDRLLVADGLAQVMMGAHHAFLAFQSRDESCPIAVRAVNLSEEPLLNVPIAVRQVLREREGIIFPPGETEGEQVVLHLPLLPGRSVARAELPCLFKTRNTSESGMSESTIAVSLNPVVQGAPLLAESLAILAAAPSDSHFNGQVFVPVSGGETSVVGGRLGQAWRLGDDKTRDALVAKLKDLPEGAAMVAELQADDEWRANLAQGFQVAYALCVALPLLAFLWYRQARLAEVRARWALDTPFGTPPQGIYGDGPGSPTCVYCNRFPSEARVAVALLGKKEAGRVGTGKQQQIIYAIAQDTLARCVRCADLHGHAHGAARYLGSMVFWGLVAAGGVTVAHEAMLGDISAWIPETWFEIAVQGAVFFVVSFVALLLVYGFTVALTEELLASATVPKGERMPEEVKDLPPYEALVAQGMDVTVEWGPDALARVAQKVSLLQRGALGSGDNGSGGRAAMETSDAAANASSGDEGRIDLGKRDGR